MGQGRHSEDRVRQLYDDAATEYARAFCNASTLQAEMHYLAAFVSHIRPGGRVLDVGCGPGIETAYILQSGLSYVGVDVSAGMVAEARKRNPTAEFRQLDMRRLDYPEGAFHGLMALESLIHFPKEEAVQLLPRLVGLLRENGVMLIALQEGTGEAHLPFPFDPGREILVNLFSEHELRCMLESLGCETLAFYRRPPLPGELPFAKLAVIARRAMMHPAIAVFHDRSSAGGRKCSG